jgi:hypothetical protein
MGRGESVTPRPQTSGSPILPSGSPSLYVYTDDEDDDNKKIIIVIINYFTSTENYNINREKHKGT